VEHRSNLSAGADMFYGLQILSYIIYFYSYNSCYANIRSFILVEIVRMKHSDLFLYKWLKFDTRQ